MASEDDQPTFNDDDFDDDDDDSEPLTGGPAVETTVDSQSSSSAVAVGEDEEEDDENSSSLPPLTPITTSEAVVTVAIPSSAVPPPPITSASSAVTVALPDPKRHSPNTNFPEKKPIDDSRRLFQRLWTDEDEIELLQGFLEYTTSRGTSGHQHHHDTAAFYDQIKSKLQLEFNKNQLVEKLRRLKKKYRNVLSKINSGKDFVFKSPHDQVTFDLSSKIWTNLSTNVRTVADIDDDDQNPNINVNMMASATPPRPPNSSYVISHINLNSAAAGAVAIPPLAVDYNKAGSATHNAGSYNSNMNMNLNSASNAVGFDVMMSNLNSPVAKLSSRKRPRTGVVKIEDKSPRNVGVEGGNLNDINNVSNNSMNNVSNNNNVGGGGSNMNLGSTMQGLIEEAVRSCLSPMVKDLVNNAVNGTVLGGGGGRGGGVGSEFKGVGALAMNAIPLNFPGANVLGSSGGDVMDEKWRKQQILELEVYSKRLELVQDQIKLSLEELRSMGS